MTEPVGSNCVYEMLMLDWLNLKLARNTEALLQMKKEDDPLFGSDSKQSAQTIGEFLENTKKYFTVHSLNIF